jgi:hypothetical protein
MIFTGIKNSLDIIIGMLGCLSKKKGFQRDGV